MEFFPTQMSLMSLFAVPSGLEITAYSRQERVLCVSLLATHPLSPCPLCGSAATRIHSRDPRRLADLPSTGQPGRFFLTVRKFFCDVPTCPRKIFTQRLVPFGCPLFARVTARLFQLDETHWPGHWWQTWRTRDRSHGYPDEQVQHSPTYHGTAYRAS